MKCKRIGVFLIVIFLFSLYLCRGQEETKKQPRREEAKPKHYVFNASFYYPLSINKSKNDSTNINLSLFYGRVGRVKGIDMAAGVSVIKNHLKGIQITGLSGVTGDTISGVQVAGLFNIAGDQLKGAQLAGIGNITGEKSKGIQVAGILNISGEHFTGMQASGIFNIVGENFNGIQGSGIFNITGENFNGLQAAGLFNVAGGDTRGVQTACINVTNHLLGVQVGIVNLSEKVSGVQVGIVNFAKHQQGIPIGLVNLAKNGRIRLTGWGSSITAINIGGKFMVNHIYSIISVGGINFYKDLAESMAYGFHYGVHFPVKASRLFFDLDAGYINIDNKTLFRAMKGTRDHQVLMLRGMLGIDISRKFSIFAGLGIRHLWNHGEVIGKGQVKPMFIIGFEAF
jgi:hypothetical protein